MSGTSSLFSAKEEFSAQTQPGWPWTQVPQGEQSTSRSIRRKARKHWSILSKEEELTTANAEFKLLNTFLHQ